MTAPTIASCSAFFSPAWQACMASAANDSGGQHTCLVVQAVKWVPTHTDCHSPAARLDWRHRPYLRRCSRCPTPSTLGRPGQTISEQNLACTKANPARRTCADAASIPQLPHLGCQRLQVRQEGLWAGLGPLQQHHCRQDGQGRKKAAGVAPMGRKGGISYLATTHTFCQPCDSSAWQKPQL